jgi:hypothetical protein
MIKILELIGLGFIGGTIYAFLVLIPQQDPMGWPFFWGCAGGALAIIIYRKKKKSNNESKDSST